MNNGIHIYLFVHIHMYIFIKVIYLQSVSKYKYLHIPRRQLLRCISLISILELPSIEGVNVA